MQSNAQTLEPEEEAVFRLVVDGLNAHAPPDGLAMRFINKLHQKQGIAAVAAFLERNTEQDGAIREKLALTKRELELVDDLSGGHYFTGQRRAFLGALLAGISSGFGVDACKTGRDRNLQHKMALDQQNERLQDKLIDLANQNLPPSQYEQSIKQLYANHQAYTDMLRKKYVDAVPLGLGSIFAMSVAMGGMVGSGATLAKANFYKKRWGCTR